MGWGEAHAPIAVGAGTTGEIEQAMTALHDVGITGTTLAAAASRAAEMIGELRWDVNRHIRQADTGSGR